MTDENTGEFRSLSIEEGAARLRELRETRNQPAEPEQATEEPEAETEEVAEDVEEAEAVEAEADVEEADDQPEDEAEDDAEPEDDDDGEDLYEVEGETFTLSELKEWKESGLRQSDYTKKTQQLAKDREALAKEREAFQSEQQQVAQQLQQQSAQLQDQLATFAIEQLPQPKRSDYKTTDDYIAARERYDEQQERKQQAAEAYRALQAEQAQQQNQQEIGKALQYFPDWNQDEVWNEALDGMTKAVSDFGISQEEILAAGLSDHRMFRILQSYADLKAQVGDQEAKRKAGAKKVAKATKRLTPGAKPSKNQGDSEVRKARSSLKKTGSIDDAVAVLRAKRRARG